MVIVQEYAQPAARHFCFTRGEYAVVMYMLTCKYMQMQTKHLAVYRRTQDGVQRLHAFIQLDARSHRITRIFVRICLNTAHARLTGTRGTPLHHEARH